MKITFFFVFIWIFLRVALAQDSSIDLIEEAYKSGKISQAKLFLYKSLLAVRYDLLPAEFKSNNVNDSKQESSTDLNLSKLGRHFSKLSLDEQILAINLLSPPAYQSNKIAESSNYNKEDDDDLPQPEPTPDWEFIENTQTKVWYKKDDEVSKKTAGEILKYIDSIHTKLSALMGKVLLKDNAYSYEYTLADGRKVTLGNGGDGRYDVYVMPFPSSSTTYGYAQTYIVDNDKVAAPSFLVINTNMVQTEKDLKGTMAHEIMHSYQYLFEHKEGSDLATNIWEGTATWAEDYVYHSMNSEHEYKKFFKKGNRSLIDESYGTWTFYFFLTKTLGNNVIRVLFNQFANNKTYDALDKAMDGGLKKQWPLYTIKEWNQTPNIDRFASSDWDSYTVLPEYLDKDEAIKMEEVKIDSALGQYVFKMDVKLKPLTRNYFAFDLSKESNARSVSVELPHFDYKKSIALNVLVKYKNKDWKTEEWNKQERDKEFCLDIESEQVEQIVLLWSHFNPKSKNGEISLEPKFKATNMGCYAYEGIIQGTVNNQSDDRIATLSMQSRVLFENEKRLNDSDNQNGGFSTGNFYLKKLDISYHYTAKDNGCTGSKSGTISYSYSQDDAMSGALGLYPYHTTEYANARMYMGTIMPPDFTPITLQLICPDDRPPVEDSFILRPWHTFSIHGNQSRKIPLNTGDIKGRSEYSENEDEFIYDYHLLPLKKQ